MHDERRKQPPTAGETWTVISPHLDDAVFGCGQWIAEHPGVLVVTVFAGPPPEGAPLTKWDERCGFASGSEAITTRRAEDWRALHMLRASPMWLDFRDRQYAAQAREQVVAEALRDVIAARDAGYVLLPLGLFHSDHLLAHDAAIAALRSLGAGSALAYEDGLYRALPGLLQERLATLLTRRLRATPAREQPGACSRRKEQAVLAYASQLHAFGVNGFTDTRRPERIWDLQFGEET